MAAVFPPFGQVLAVAGTNIATSYVAAGTSGVINVGRKVKRLRLYLHFVTAALSNLTTITVKLQHRYSDPAGATRGWQDLPSSKSDVGATAEIEHTFTVTANQTSEGYFFLDEPEGILDLQLLVKANAAGIAGDSITVEASAGHWM